MKTCWQDENSVGYMVSSLALHKPLNEISHGIILKKFIEHIYDDSYEFLDVGCGGGLVSSLIPSGKYTGVDLPHIIDKFTKLFFNQHSYIKCDLENEDLSFLKDYDVLIMNAFIDVVKEPLIMLDKILENAPKYIIIHRQIITSKYKTTSIINQAYNGLTFCSILNDKDLSQLLDKHNYEILLNENSGIDDKYYSILIKKKN